MIVFLETIKVLFIITSELFEPILRCSSKSFVKFPPITFWKLGVFSHFVPLSDFVLKTRVSCDTAFSFHNGTEFTGLSNNIRGKFSHNR